MKYFSMIGGIDQLMLERFIEFYNNNGNEEIRVILNTSGGSYFCSETIIEMINTHPSCSLIIQGAYSAGFVICFFTTCEKALSKSARGMVHYGKWDMTYNDKNKPYYHEDVCIIKNMPFHKRQAERIAKKVMTKDELKRFLKDDDVYFDFKRMKQIFCDAKVLK